MSNPWEALEPIRSGAVKRPLKPNPYLRSEVQMPDGSTRPLVLRDYQIQMVAHLCMIPRFVVGDDTGLGKCVTGDSLILTSRGYVPISAMGDADAPEGFHPPSRYWEVWVGDRWAPVRQFYTGGAKPTLRVTTARGYTLQGTLVHPVRVVRNGAPEWVRLVDLQAGDRVVLERSTIPWPEDLPWRELDASPHNQLLQGSRNTVVSHIRGLLEGQTQGSARILRVVGEAYSHVLQILLLRLGVVCSRSPGPKDVWVLSFTQRDWSVLQQGFVQAPPKGLLSDPVVSLEEQGPQAVYDLEVAAPEHCFVANGMWAHNTVETISALTVLFAKQPQASVLVLTLKSTVTQWVEEFERFTQGVKTFIYRGTPVKRAKILESFRAYDEGPKVLISGYRVVVQDFVQFQEMQWDVFVGDEAAIFANSATQVHQVVHHIAAYSSRAWGLTATVLKNNLVEGWGVFRVIEPAAFGPYNTLNKFMEDFCIVEMQMVKNRKKIPVIRGHKPIHIDNFKRRLEGYYLGRPKHDVAPELPPLVSRIITCGMSGIQALKYEEALQGLLEVHDEMKEVTPLTQVTYCQEIVNHPKLIGCEGESDKLDILVDLLTEGDLKGEKVVVYTRFEKMVGIGVAALEARGIKCARITGAEAKDEVRDAEKRKFMDPHSGVQVIWITNAGNAGINLQIAKALVFYDCPFSAGDYLQILGRIIRIGSLHDRVYALHLITEGSIDEKVLATVHRKLDLIEAVLGKRLKGEEDLGTDFTVSQDISDIFRSLKADALRRRSNG